MRNILDIILENKKTTIEDFFNLERRPEFPSTSIDELKVNVTKILNNLKHSNQFCQLNDNSIYDELSKIKHYTIENDNHIIVLENTIDEYKYAYDSLMSLISEMISKEDIDLTKYSTNITKSDWIKINRSKRIDKLI